MTAATDHPLKDQSALRWAFLEQEPHACVVVSDRLEFVYANAAARQLLSGEWFGKHCFEVLPVTDETCAFHCQKIRAVNESPDVIYCEEALGPVNVNAQIFGVGLIPLGPKGDDHARAVFLLRQKPRTGDEQAFRTQVLQEAEAIRKRIASALA